MKTFAGAAFAAFALLALPSLAGAQGSQSPVQRTWAVSLAMGIAGSVDEDDGGYDNSILQLGASVVLEPDSRLGVRVGRIDFGDDEVLGDVAGAEMSYVTIAGEYLFGEAAFQSGMFLGLGAYKLEGTEVFSGLGFSSTTVGLTGGVTGDFDVSGNVAIIAELQAHAVPTGEAEFFVGGLIGIQFYFD